MHWVCSRGAPKAKYQPYEQAITDNVILHTVTYISWEKDFEQVPK